MSKINEAYQNCYGERGDRSPGNRGNVTLIHPMSYKLKLLTDVVLQCLVEKYVITF